ncbi:MAG: A/G-specific adenine glycosylase [Spirulinaceae cyanobacterium RM2_2_10]|nr:A/G-specific adenine glycosylase [Spirulinaceae cyanobacterium SM2_1_0]NJO19223.1 A/G-specific adenine glycosylase [Spirulinaceae cyanobacterium RM2_2_10]
MLPTAQTQQLAAAIPTLQSRLLAWYGQQGRELPWRGDRDPYRIWISEVILQQTQVKTALPYYERFLAHFPNIATLASADLQQVLKVWQGLGYYARARHLHKAAQQLVEQHGGHFPTELAAVMALPGIGRTTAGGILSAAFDQPVAILDGNVKRVLSRLLALPVPPAKATKLLWQWSERLLSSAQPRDFNQALMDLGATVCTPRQPQCSACPWAIACQAHHHNLQAQIPMREATAPLPHKRIGVAVIRNTAGQVLIDRRREEGLLGGLWEFPGGKIEAGETIADCIRREIREELAIEIEVGAHLITVEHAYSHFRLTLYVHECRHRSGEAQPLESQEVRWVSVEELDQFPFPQANVQIVAAIQAREAGGPDQSP